MLSLTSDNEFEVFVGDKRLLHIGRLQQLATCLITAVAFCLAAYASRYFSTAFMHDSLEIASDQISFDWQIGLGRWLQPVLWAIRGHINAPWLLGLVSMPFFALASWLITDVLQLEGRASVVCVTAVIVTAMPIALGHATYIPWVDVYAIALYLSVLAVWLCVRSRYWFLAALPLVGSLALYQSYLQFFTGLVVLVLMRRCLNKDIDAHEILSLILRFSLALVAGLGIYWLSTICASWITGIEKVESYNGITEVGTYDGGVRQVMLLLRDTWCFPLSWFWGATGFVRRILAISLWLGSIVLAAKALWASPLWKKALFVVLLLAFPFAIDVVYFVSKGMEHDLMVHSFYLAYVLPLMLIDVASEDNKGLGKWTLVLNKTRRPIRLVTVLAVSVLMAICLLSVRYANQIMLERQLEYESTHVLMARVIDRMEQTEGYVAGETPVVFIGIPSDTVAERRAGFPEPRWGMEYLTGLTYQNPYRWYFETVLGLPINIVPGNELNNTPEVKAMGAFPAKDSVHMVGDTLVVKLW